MKNRFRLDTILLTAALLIAGAAVLPLWESDALLNTRGGGDSPFLLQRVHQLVTALQDGHFPVRWVPDANYGYGYPFFNYYAPLSIYVAGAFRLLGFAFTRAIQLAQLAGFLVAAWGVFGLARCWGWREWQALLASAAYTLAPFHLVNVYVRGDSLAEFWAMAFYPLVFWAAERLLRSNHFSAETVLPLSLAYAGLVLSHNISAFIFTPFLGLYIVYCALIAPQRLRLLRDALLAGLLGLALSAWFWLPALGEQGLVQLGPVTEGYFHYSGHFLNAALVQASGRFSYDVTASQNPFRMGLVQALAIGLAAVAVAGSAARRRAVNGPVAFVLAAVLVSTFMLLSQSDWLWAHVPLLSFTQFPWRFLSIQAFFGALLIGAALPRLARVEPVLVLGIIGLLLWSALGDLHTDFLRLTDDDISAESVAQYEWFTANIGTTISAEYLPHSVQPRPWTSRWLQTGDRYAATVLRGVADVQNSAHQTSAQRWQVDVASNAATVVLPLLLFDGWVATDSAGLPIALSAAAGSGLAQLTLPAGSHTVTVVLQRTPIRAAAELISLAALVAALWAGRHAIGRSWRLLLALGVGLLALGVGLHFGAPSAETPALQAWDFAQQAYLDRPEAISFANGATLLAVEYDREAVTAGDTLRVTLRWTEQSSGSVGVALTTPAQHRRIPSRLVPSVASASAEIKDGVAVVDLELPANAPSGLFVPRLLFDSAPLTESGMSRGDLFFKPLRVLPLVEPLADDVEGIDAAVHAVERLASGDLLVRAQWLTDAPLSENYQATWRVYDRFGRFFAEIDTQPGYGYQPTSLWRPNQPVNDWVQLKWLADDGIEPFSVVAALYRTTDGAPIFQKRVAQLRFAEAGVTLDAAPALTMLPADIELTQAQFEDKISLRGYQLEQSDTALVVTLFWEALRDDLPNYHHFVHLIDPATGAVLRQHDGEPQFGTNPTGRWRQHNLIDDLAVLYLDGVPPGAYQLQIGLYQNLGDQFPRLALAGSAFDALIVESPIIVRE